jgi:hypothetical protein
MFSTAPIEESQNNIRIFVQMQLTISKPNLFLPPDLVMKVNSDEAFSNPARTTSILHGFRYSIEKFIHNPVFPLLLGKNVNGIKTDR